MHPPATVDQFLDRVRQSGLVEEQQLAAYLEALRTGPEDTSGSRPKMPDTPKRLARRLIRAGLLTCFQADQLLLGKTRGFTISGKYKLLEHLGAGGMGSVYLCEHTAMRRRVAIKVLPLARVGDSSYLERFYREARAVAALDHPNIVRAHDIDHDGKLHFLVMEYVDGSSLLHIVDKHGPLSVERAADYIAQAAAGLQHAHETAGLVHRDVKPGNLLVDRGGTVKVLDMGLARFFHEDDSLSKKYDETVLGSLDYLAPEQCVNSSVDIRADVFALGATFYFCLTGRTLFGDGTTAEKLIWQQVRQPRPLRAFRPEIPEELAAVIEKRMLAKEARERYQEPAEVIEALAPWTHTPIPPPPAEEMPRLCLAAQSRSLPGVPPDSGRSPAAPGSSVGPRTPQGARLSRKVWSIPASRKSGTDAATSAEKGDPPTLKTAVQEVSPTRPACRQGSSGIWEEVPEVPAAGSATFPPAPVRRRGAPWWALAVLVLLVVAAAGGGAWWTLAGLFPTFQDVPGRQVHNPPGSGKLAPEGVAITLENDVRRVRTANYEAVVEADGCLTSLCVGGVEFLHKGGNISRGSYFFQPGVGALKLPRIEQPAANVLTATGDKASIRYEFGADTLSWTVTNATGAALPFFLVFDPAVKAVRGDRDEWAKLPAVRDWQTTTWFAGKARLAVTGGTRIWGPFEERYPVWEASLTPQETRRVVLQAGAATEAEVARAAEVSWERRVRTAHYQAVIEGDGCLTSLRVGDAELLWVGGDTSRGTYFHDGRTLKLPAIEEPASNVLAAKSDKASIRYEFGPDTLTYTISNATRQPLSFFMVFGPAVKAVRNDKGEWAKVPAARDWQTTTWFAGKVRLEISGGRRIWGPWGEGHAQVWDGSLAPGEARRVVLKVGTVTEDETAQVGVVTGVRPAGNPDLPVRSPLDYQVFQRYSRDRGQITLRGSVKPSCDALEARLTGTSLEGKLPDKWQRVAFDKLNRTFDSTLPTPAGGWYRLELRALRDGNVVARTVVEHVGIGEVFVCAGQSNSTNCGEELLRPASGMVASFGGESWQPADDPQPGVHDRTSGGSNWPAFGDALYEKYHVPIGIASTGHSGSSVTQWQPEGELFKWTEGRIRQLGVGGFRAVLWHQGESDVGMTADEYARLLTNVIVASKKEAGWDFPWFVARVSYHNPGRPSFEAVRAGQKKLWEGKVALEGPDTDTLRGENRDNGGKGIHFSGKGQHAHGKLWAEKVSAYLDRVLAE
jgi:serine/threonine protein kinase